MAKVALPSLEVLRQLVTYDPETGKVHFKSRDRSWFADNRFGTSAFVTWSKRKAGSEAFALRSDGYVAVNLLGRSILAHRLGWAMTYGVWPTSLDHINGDRTDNRIANLREVTQAENNRNLSIRSTNKSGVNGICLFRGKKWHAYINHGGRKLHLGFFDAKEDAILARKEAEREYNYHPNHGREMRT